MILELLITCGVSEGPDPMGPFQIQCVQILQFMVHISLTLCKAPRPDNTDGALYLL